VNPLRKNEEVSQVKSFFAFGEVSSPESLETTSAASGRGVEVGLVVAEEVREVLSKR